MVKPPLQAWVGFGLGWGAPLGALVLKYALSHATDIKLWTLLELESHPLLYVYLTVSTVAAFTLFGYVLGRRASAISRYATVLADSSESLDRMAMTDSLTGLYNHGYIQERLEVELERSQRHQTPLAVLMIDIDDFKSLNDRYGHAFGDKVLKHVTDLLQATVRKVDIVGRYGGEEFLVILPQTSQKTAMEVAERIREAIAADVLLDQESDKKVKVTVTIGMACVPREDLPDRKALVRAADKAMYRGKFEGKNRVTLSVPAPNSARGEMSS